MLVCCVLAGDELKSPALDGHGQYQVGMLSPARCAAPKPTTPTARLLPSLNPNRVNARSVRVKQVKGQLQLFDAARRHPVQKFVFLDGILVRLLCLAQNQPGHVPARVPCPSA